MGCIMFIKQWRIYTSNDMKQDLLQRIKSSIADHTLQNESIINNALL